VDTVHECDRRTDRQTDRITITKTVQRIASHGKNPSGIDVPGGLKDSTGRLATPGE